jgi:hypothetical protein
VPSLPAAALENSHHVYTFEENPFGWNSVEFAFEPGRDSAQVILNEIPLKVGLDHIYRSSEISPGSEILLRGRWEGKDVFVLDYPYPLNGPTVLGELGESQLRFRFSGNGMEVTAQQVVFGGEPLILKANRE